MDDKLYKSIKKLKKDELLELLVESYQHLKDKDTKEIFGKYTPSNKNNFFSDTSITHIEKFKRKTFEGKYYQYFEVNYKNFDYIPEKTEEWFDTVEHYLNNCCKLSEKGEHEKAIKGFTILYELLDRLDEEFVFADELNTHLLGGDDEIRSRCFVQSSYAINKVEDFPIPLKHALLEDSYSSYSPGFFKRILELNIPAYISSTRDFCDKNQIRYPEWFIL